MIELPVFMMKLLTSDVSGLTDAACQQVVATLTATERFVNLALVVVLTLLYNHVVTSLTDLRGCAAGRSSGYPNATAAII